MDGSKFMELRKQMEENNQDIQDFLGDIDQWKSSVEQKNARLMSKSVKPDETLPAIRNIMHSKKKKRKSHAKSNPVNRIRSWDYSAWDNFDVDKALGDVDKVGERILTEDSETDEEWENERRLNLANTEKDQGNLRFKEGKFEEAVEHYTTAIHLAPENPLLYTNRALGLCKLERFASAESDCSSALSINPKLVKALYRRAHARKSLDKVDDAIADLKRVLDIEPENIAALRDLSAWLGRPVLHAGSVNSIFSLIPCSDIPKAVSSSFRRIPISEVGARPPKTTKHTGGDSCDVKPLSTKAPNRLPSPCGRCGDSLRVVTPTSPTGPPRNWYQMERELRELVPIGQPFNQLAVDYLCLIEPANYACVIGQNLDSTCLGRLLTAFSMNSTLTANQKADRMEALVKLPRFDVAWLLAEDLDREKASAVLKEIDPTRIEELKKAFF